MKFFTRTSQHLLATAVAAGFAFGSSSALAAHLPAFSFTETPFTVNPGAVGEPNASFDATFIDFSYAAEVDQSGNNFDETGGGFFGTFRTTLGGSPVPGTGLGTDYQMYMLFDGTGSVAPGPGGVGVDGAFSTFNISFFVDTAMDTVLSSPTIGGADEAITVAAGGGDDVQVLTGTLIVGGFHVFPGLAGGDFDVLIDATPIGGFFGGPAFADGTATGDFNGVNTQVLGVTPPPSHFIDGIIIGSGNTSFQPVPEPQILLLMGGGLLGMVAVARRRKSIS